MKAMKQLAEAAPAAKLLCSSSAVLVAAEIAWGCSVEQPG